MSLSLEHAEEPVGVAILPVIRLLHPDKIIDPRSTPNAALSFSISLRVNCAPRKLNSAPDLHLSLTIETGLQDRFEDSW